MIAGFDGDRQQTVASEIEITTEVSSVSRIHVTDSGNVRREVTLMMIYCTWARGAQPPFRIGPAFSVSSNQL